MAVGIGSDNDLRADDAAGAGPVVDHHLLAERFAELDLDEARIDVGLPAGREADDDADRVIGEIRRRIGFLRKCGERDGGGKYAEGYEVWTKLEVEGEMHSDAALSTFIREEIFQHSRLKGAANLLVMPGLDAANIAFNLLKVTSDAVVLGPILLGAAKPVHIVTPSVTVRGLLNMSAIAGIQRSSPDLAAP